MRGTPRVIPRLPAVSHMGVPTGTPPQAQQCISIIDPQGIKNIFLEFRAKVEPIFILTLSILSAAAYGVQHDTTSAGTAAR